MPETKRGGRRPGAGRPPGSPNKPKPRGQSLIALAKSVEEAIKQGDYKTAKDHSEKLAYILSFIPAPAE